MNDITRRYNLNIFNCNSIAFRQNKNSPYKGNATDKDRIFEILDKKFAETMTLSADTIGHKNLIYFTVYGMDYSMLLHELLHSLRYYCKTLNFDILIITDVYTQKMLLAFDFIKNKKFNVDFHIVKPPVDGVEASMNKLLVFDYKNINNYNNILFLDTDIICTKDITYLFNRDYEDKLSCVISPIMTRPAGEGLLKAAVLTHSLGHFSERIKNRLNEYVPFNAGQFIFKNTKRMRQHFENVKWLASIWPSVYFYEQSFLNHYFVFYDLVIYKDLNELCLIHSQVPNLRESSDSNFTVAASIQSLIIAMKSHTPEHGLLHFAGCTLDGRNKYAYIKVYCLINEICL